MIVFLSFFLPTLSLKHTTTMLVTLFISSSDTYSERRFHSDFTVGQLKVCTRVR